MSSNKYFFPVELDEKDYIAYGAMNYEFCDALADSSIDIEELLDCSKYGYNDLDM